MPLKYKTHLENLFLKGRRNDCLALLFYLAEKWRCEDDNWTDSIPVYESLMEDYLNDNNRHRAMYVLSELILARNQKCQSIDDETLYKLCTRFLTHGFLVPVLSEEWKKYIIHRRFQQTMFIITHVLFCSTNDCDERLLHHCATFWIHYINLANELGMISQNLASCWPLAKESKSNILRRITLIAFRVMKKNNCLKEQEDECQNRVEKVIELLDKC